MVGQQEAAATTGRRTVVGVFADAGGAERALAGLREAGFAPRQVSVVARDSSAAQVTAERQEAAGAPVAASAGAVLGGLGGAVLGWLIGLATLAVPGVGPLVVAGALATTLAGAAAGAVAGGLVGALVDAGVPHEEARGYEEHVRGGRLLLTVDADTDEQAHRAREIFDREGGADVRAYGLAGAAPGTAQPGTGVVDSDPIVDEGHSGHMVGGGVAGAATGAVVGAIVGGPPGAAVGAAIGGAIGAGAGVLAPDDDADGAPEADADYDRHRPAFQQHYAARQADSPGGAQASRTWEEAEPNYRYGYAAGRQERYQGREFDDIEADLRAEYEERSRAAGRDVGDSWQQLREEIREGWNRARGRGTATG
jgi:hypothetical protein